MKKALIVWGGWEGHEPEAGSKVVNEMLTRNGFDVRIETETSVLGSDEIHELDLVVPIYTMSEIEKADAVNLAKFESFERLCAATLGRTVDTSQPGAELRGPDRRDPCSANADCLSCSGECGWCKDEVTDPRTLRRTGGGWCSGECTTTDGECASVDTGGGH